MYKIAEVTEEGEKYGSYLPWEFLDLSGECGLALYGVLRRRGETSYYDQG